MSRYIDADALWESAETCRETTGAFQALIESAPTVDAVQVVRCKECKKRYTPWCFAHRHGESKDNFYCADGERKDGETEQCNTYSLGKIEMPKGAIEQIIADGERKDGAE